PRAARRPMNACCLPCRARSTLGRNAYRSATSTKSSKPSPCKRIAASIAAPEESTMQKSFWQAGHKPTLFSAFLYFDLSFMVWVLLGPLAVQMAIDLQLTAAEKGMMVATPVLAGALLRIVMGVLVDHIKPKMAGLVGQVIVIIALTVAWLHGIDNFQQALMLGIFLGFAGASFAVALPLASRWYPPEKQGSALGIDGASSPGTVLAA